MTTEKASVPPAVVHTTAGLRQMLFDEVDRMRNSISTPAEANAVARLAKEITATVKLELEAKKLSLKMAESDNLALPAPIDLGLTAPTTKVNQ